MTPLNLKPGVGLDLDALRDGRWFRLRSAPGFEVRLRPWENEEFRRLRAEAWTDRNLGADERPPEEEEAWAEELENRLIAETILVDWRGEVPTDSETGKPVAYSIDHGIDLLSQERYGAQKLEIVRLASSQRSFRERVVREMERDLGNASGASSNGEGTGKPGPGS